MNRSIIRRISTIAVGITFTAGMVAAVPAQATETEQAPQASQYHGNYGPATSSVQPDSQRPGAPVPAGAMAIAEGFASRDPQRIEQTRRHTAPGSEADRYVHIQSYTAQVDQDAGVYIEQEAYRLIDGVAVCWTDDGLEGPCARFTDWETNASGKATTFKVNGVSIDGRSSFGNGESDKEHNVEVEYVASDESDRTNIFVRITNHRFAPIELPELAYRVNGQIADSAYIVAPDRIEARSSVLVRLCLSGTFDRGGVLTAAVEDIGVDLTVPVPQ